MRDMRNISRICFNTNSWQRPSGDATALEAKGTYNHNFGFGHEEWLFRNDWVIDGWRYAFIQGVNDSQERLLKDLRPIDLTLFTIEPDSRRRYVARIYELECLTQQQSEEAVAAFKERGWYDLMLDEIRSVGGDVGTLGHAEWAPYILNVRFRLANLSWYPPSVYAEAEDPIVRRFKRYQFNDFDEECVAYENARRKRKGQSEAASQNTITRSGHAGGDYTPEHARMQARLLEELKLEYPNDSISCEENYVDITLKTPTELVLFEIKSDLAPRTVLRLAIGQLLEYAFHAGEQRLPVRLVAVGRLPLQAVEQRYLDDLQTRYGLPLEYRVVCLD